MAHLTVLEFPTADGAERLESKLSELQQQHLLDIQDAAIVSWPKGAKKPKTRQLHNLSGLGALDGAFWGLLFGILFFIPILGMAIGAAIGALTASFADVGIDDSFIKRVREEVTEGTSALFLLTSNEVVDRIAEALKNEDFKIIATNLPKEREDKLKEAFAHS
jgi:uncharacterized membrane protein